jgi:PKD repeat protein
MVNWGVVGTSAESGSLRTNWTTTAVGTAPNPISGNAAFNTIGGAVKTIYQVFTTAGVGQSGSDAASDSISWNTETINGILASDYVNAFENPNVTGPGSDSFFVQLDNGAAATLLGGFTLAANGIVTYNAASSTPNPPVASFTGTPTSGFAPLKVIFTDASTGGITNWLWNFGNGTLITNSTAANVTNIYTAAGSYTVTETVTGAGGAGTNKLTGYVVVAATPKLGGVTLPGGKLVFSGTNGPAGVQYRILTTTNLALPITSWIPVLTNTVSSNSSYGYTNNAPTNGVAFFRLVSP